MLGVSSSHNKALPVTLSFREVLVGGTFFMSSVPLLNPYCVLGRLDGGWRILFVGLGKRSFLADA